MRGVYTIQPLSACLFKDKVKEEYNDIYLVFVAGDQQIFSGIAKKSENTPIWNEQVKLYLNEDLEEIRVEIHDYKIKNGTYIGYCHIRPAHLTKKQQLVQCYEIYTNNSSVGDGKIGQISLEINFYQQGQEKTVIKQYNSKTQESLNQSLEQNYIQQLSQVQQQKEKKSKVTETPIKSMTHINITSDKKHLKPRTSEIVFQSDRKVEQYPIHSQSQIKTSENIIPPGTPASNSQRQIYQGFQTTSGHIQKPSYTGSFVDSRVQTQQYNQAATNSYYPQTTTFQTPIVQRGLSRVQTESEMQKMLPQAQSQPRIINQQQQQYSSYYQQAQPQSSAYNLKPNINSLQPQNISYPTQPQRISVPQQQQQYQQTGNTPRFNQPQIYSQTTTQVRRY